MKIAVILLVSGQLAALALIVLREVVFGRTGDDWDVLVALAVGSYLTAVGAGIVFIVLLVLRFVHRLPEAGAEFLEEVDTAQPEGATWTAVGVDVVGGLGLFVAGYAGMLLTGST